ncbi:MAG: NPCBM/NEW2 domain-containing protein [Pirellulales bacterium]|nr:NPCBM/NEW2 domain-containing protein [Pirellulales bacterium]
MGVPVEGEPFRAELVACDPAWTLTFQPDRALAAENLVRWGDCPDPARGSAVVLADESLVVGDLLEVSREAVRIDSKSCGLVRLPSATVAGVIFELPGDAVRRDRLLDRVLRAEDRSDVVLLANGDQLGGSLTEVDSDAIHLDTTSGPTSLELGQAEAIIFHPALRRRARRDGLGAWVGLADGSRVACARLAMEDRQASLIPAAVEDADWQTAPREVVFLQPFGGRAQYLSDRRPDAFRHIPFLDLAWPYENDRNGLGGRLRSGNRLYLKGLGAHGSSCLTYVLTAPCEAFAAELALDDAAGSGGSVRFRVYVDRRKRFESDVLRGGDEPAPVRVDLAGAKRLDLIVDFADRADQLDRADWLDARLIRRPDEPSRMPASEPSPP